MSLCHRRKSCDALLITDDIAARGLLLGLAKLGIWPGRDVLVASHVNRGSSTLLGFEADLISLVIDPAAFADAMLELLDAQLSGERKPRQVLIEPAVVPPGGTS
jgi:DNA-binding LacI/PurR family transcriptional regulator